MEVFKYKWKTKTNIHFPAYTVSPPFLSGRRERQAVRLLPTQHIENKRGFDYMSVCARS